VVAGLLLAAMLWPAFRQLERLNQQLTQRNKHLLRANQELALAARAAALGSVSAHLMHGLKNPLASLSQFVSSRRTQEQDDDEEDWHDALAAARRMQSLVEQTLEVLSDAQGAPPYDVRVPELTRTVRERITALAHDRGVELIVQAEMTEILSSRVANLISLILVNLLQNALQATPAGKRVTLSAVGQGDRLFFRVQDQGSGFPPHLRESLFLPCRSTREGGSGIGLAICKQLADHLGASLVLEESGAGGCLFALGVPVAALREPMSVETHV
jgi:signal transduction histidine kinase